jgi:hypothetical protein
MCPSSLNWPLKSTQDTICTMCSSASLRSVARRFTETAKSTGRIAQERDNHVARNGTVLSHGAVFLLKTPLFQRNLQFQVDLVVARVFLQVELGEMLADDLLIIH